MTGMPHMRVVVPLVALILANPLLGYDASPSYDAPSALHRSNEQRRTPVNLCETTRQSEGTTRYYVNGRRVSKERMREIKRDHALDTFQTVCKGDFIRQHCCARKKAA